MLRKTDPASFQSYLSDASRYTGTCEQVVFPETAQEVAALLAECNRTNTTVTISGNGTGVTGGRCPDGGVLLATDKLQAVIEVNTGGQYLLCEAGVTLERLHDALFSLGFFFPPDPTEPLCFVGGMIATNASGARSFYYGSIRKFVLALEVVLPSGELLFIERGKFFADGYTLTLPTQNKQVLQLPAYQMPPGKNAAGYFIYPNMDLVDLFIGAEGTLGVVTKVKLRITPLPERIISCIAFFKEETNAMLFVDAARELSVAAGGIRARALEFFDARALEFLRPAYPRVPADSRAAVWFEQECISADEELLMVQWFSLLEQYGGAADDMWYASDGSDLRVILEFRHAISYKVNEFISQHGLRKLGTDTAVPVHCFTEFYGEIKAMVEGAGIAYVAYGHFGDAHVHLNMLPKTSEQFAEAKNVYHAICAEAVRRGGTVSAEHGIGKSKRPYLLMMYGEETVSAMKHLKLQVDPRNLLNKGNLFL